jgi:hypothetical protein
MPLTSTSRFWLLPKKPIDRAASASALRRYFLLRTPNQPLLEVESILLADLAATSLR